MAVPNLKHIVQQVRDSQVWTFKTKEDLCRYTQAVVLALHRADQDFVHLRKRKPKNGCYKAGANEGHAVDAALYLPTGQAVDFIGSAGFGDPAPPNKVTWSLHGEGEYDAEDGIVPDPDGTEPGPVDPPPPSGELDARVTALEREVSHHLERLAELTVKTKTAMDLVAAIEQNHGQRIVWLETGQTGPEYHGSGTGNGRIFGINIPVSVDVTSRPVPKPEP